jgi:hypothetical protein
MTLSVNLPRGSKMFSVGGKTSIARTLTRKWLSARSSEHIDRSPAIKFNWF